MALGSCKSVSELADIGTSKDNLFSLRTRPGGISVSFVVVKRILSDAMPFVGFCAPGPGVTTNVGDSDTAATTGPASSDSSFGIGVVAVSSEAAGSIDKGGGDGEELLSSDTWVEAMEDLEGGRVDISGFAADQESESVIGRLGVFNDEITE